MKSKILILEEPHGDDTASLDKRQIVVRIVDFDISSKKGGSISGHLGPTVLFLEKLDHVQLVIIDDFFAYRVVEHDGQKFLLFLFIGCVVYAVEAVVVVFERKVKEFEVSVQVRAHGVTLEPNTKAQGWQFGASMLDSESYFDVVALTLPADVA